MIVLLLSVVVLEQRNQTGKTDCGESMEMSSLDIWSWFSCGHKRGAPPPPHTPLYRNSHLIRAQKFNDDISICSHARNSGGIFNRCSYSYTYKLVFLLFNMLLQYTSVRFLCALTLNLLFFIKLYLFFLNLWQKFQIWPILSKIQLFCIVYTPHKLKWLFAYSISSVKVTKFEWWFKII